jgi:hypothetical protein
MKEKVVIDKVGEKKMTSFLVKEVVRYSQRRLLIMREKEFNAI